MAISNGMIRAGLSASGPNGGGFLHRWTPVATADDCGKYLTFLIQMHASVAVRVLNTARRRQIIPPFLSSMPVRSGKRAFLKLAI
jgi:hypothetical protein